LVDRDLYASYNDDLYGLHDLFKTKEEVNLVVFGDSISEGHSSSGLWNHEPYQPQYAKLVAKGIEKYGSVKVNFTNLSVGGKDSDWAAEEEQIDKLTKAEPDILIVAFGTNDTAAHLSSKRYANNIRTIIESARSVNPSCQIVLVAPFSSNPESKGVAAQQDNVARLKEIVASEDYLDVICVDMYAPTAEMLTKKNYYEISGNGINHPNDFIHRIYAMNILSAMFDLSQKS
jgi:lysophospholipase L1-like esterase